MRIHDLTPDECRAILEKTNLGRLACARANQPYIVPVFFYFDAAGSSLCSFSTAGQKIDWMRENPKVCVEIEDISDKNTWTTVVVFGRYDEIEQTREDANARRRAFDLFQRNAEWWLPGAGKLPSEEQQPAVVYRIQIERMSGRRAARHA
jgi:nitroimidazol reductase NimA-like FMN-containing flavoprotein (pyridoxamine 5'-phosphate oxidase superfamily)